MATTIQFYHLLSTSRERAVPKLMEKALKAGNRVVMIMDSDAALKTMSDALWTNDPAGFLPHGSLRDGHAEAQPIFLSLTDSNPNNADICCVLDGSMPQSPERFTKLLDVFDGNDEAATAGARKRWAEYKAKGYALQYIKQQPGGGWKMEMESAASAA